MSFAISKDPYQQNGTLGILAGCRNTAGNSLSTVQSFEDFGWEIYLILIDSTTSNNKTRPFRNKKAIRERKVIHRQSSSRDWEEKEDLSNLDRHPSCYNFSYRSQSRWDDATLSWSYQVFSSSPSISWSTPLLLRSSKSPLATARYTRCMSPDHKVCASRPWRVN